jgi:S-adenosylmethionine/arginine decarboxylase-like enzyme
MKQWLLFFFLLPIPITQLRAAEVPQPWGYHTLIDLKDCDPNLIRSRTHINAYVVALCNMIDMKRFGEPMIVHFGEDPHVSGYSLVQLIETSLVSGHFVNESNTAYIDIFSCKPYNHEKAIRFTQEAFHGNVNKVHIIERQ